MGTLLSNPEVDKINCAYQRRVQEHRQDKQSMAEYTRSAGDKKLHKYKNSKRPTIVPQAPSLIINGLYLGNMYDVVSSSSSQLQSLNITAVVNATTISYDLPRNIQTIQMNIEDDEYENIHALLPVMVHFIEEKITEGRNVMVHCEHGVSRSATIVAAFLIKNLEMSAVDALKMTRQKRKLICPNEGFLESLVAFDTKHKVKLKDLKTVCSAV